MLKKDMFFVVCCIAEVPFSLFPEDDMHHRPAHFRFPFVECEDIPALASCETAYRLTPRTPDLQYYRERTDRNIGWITREEQERLKGATIGIAGCGGMGGLLASIFFRLGVGEVRIADCEDFDISNINRQFAAGRGTVGKSKAFETARLTRSVTDDGTLVVYPMGITAESAESFVSGCDIICDEIEFWAIGSRLLLHIEARQQEVPLFVCCSEGAGTRMLLFAGTGQTLETMLGMELEEGIALQHRINRGIAHDHEVRRAMQAMIAAVAPELPNYSPEDPAYDTRKAVTDRLFREQRAPILATNPIMAAGFLANHAVLKLLEGSGVIRNAVRCPAPPGYLHFDSWTMDARAVERKEVIRDDG